MRVTAQLQAGALAAAVILGVALAATPPAEAADASAQVHSVGDITFHPKSYVGKHVVMRGYLLKQEAGYVLVSDESSGKIGPRDLPVSGTGIDTLKPGQLFVIEGEFLDHGLKASNGNRYHLELTAPPKPAAP